MPVTSRSSVVPLVSLRRRVQNVFWCHERQQAVLWIGWRQHECGELVERGAPFALVWLPVEEGGPDVFGCGAGAGTDVEVVVACVPSHFGAPGIVEYGCELASEVALA